MDSENSFSAICIERHPSCKHSSNFKSGEINLNWYFEYLIWHGIVENMLQGDTSIKKCSCSTCCHTFKNAGM